MSEMSEMSERKNVKREVCAVRGIKRNSVCFCFCSIVERWGKAAGGLRRKQKCNWLWQEAAIDMLGMYWLLCIEPTIKTLICSPRRDDDETAGGFGWVPWAAGVVNFQPIKCLGPEQRRHTFPGFVDNVSNFTIPAVYQ